MSNLLLFTEVSEDFTKIVSYVGIGVVALAAIAALLFVCYGKNKPGTKEIVYAGVTVAASFALSFIKISPVTYGGSITLASLVPILLFTYFFGARAGLLAGIVYGVLQFVQDPYILTPVTFVLDYLLAFASVALMGLPKLFMKSKSAAVIVGVTFTYAARFIMHFLSGLVYFEMDAIWTNLPASNGALYSFLYQVVYLVPDYIICIIVFGVLLATGTVERLRPEHL